MVENDYDTQGKSTVGSDDGLGRWEGTDSSFTAHQLNSDLYRLVDQFSHYAYQ